MPDIQYLGHSCFRIRGRDGVVLMDPCDQSTTFDIGRPTASIITVSHDHQDHTNVEAVRPLKDDKLNIFRGPGEYEVSGILITGVRTYHDKKKGAERGRNVVFVVHIDDVSIAHLGDLGHDLTASQIEEIGDIDVLFIPVGGHDTINASEAASVITQLEPRLVIPMHYAASPPSAEYEMDPLDRFLQEMNIKEPTFEEKLTVTSSNLPPEGIAARVVLMRPTGSA
jgi:L-ascorbate metabolism protein UlaG (beta-lactamase superfamily)